MLLSVTEVTEMTYINYVHWIKEGCYNGHLINSLSAGCKCFFCANNVDPYQGLEKDRSDHGFFI